MILYAVMAEVVGRAAVRRRHPAGHRRRASAMMALAYYLRAQVQLAGRAGVSARASLGRRFKDGVLGARCMPVDHPRRHLRRHRHCHRGRGARGGRGAVHRRPSSTATSSWKHVYCTAVSMAAMQTAVVMMLVAGSAVIGIEVLANEQLPQTIAQGTTALHERQVHDMSCS